MLIMVSLAGFLTAAEPHLYSSFSRLVEAIDNSIVTEIRLCGFSSRNGVYSKIYNLIRH